MVRFWSMSGSSCSGLVRAAAADLQGPVARGVPAEARRPRVEAGVVDIVAVLVGLAAREARGLQLPDARHDACGDHAVGHVGGVEPMVVDRGLRARHAREAMQICDRAQRRFARWAAIDEGRDALRDGMAVGGGELSDQVVRVLAVDEAGAAVGGLPGLQEEGVAALADGGVERGQAAQGQRPPRQRSRGDAHQVAEHEGLVRPAGASLAVVDEGGVAVGHHRPLAEAQVQALVRGAVRLPGGARGVAGGGVCAERAGHVGHVHVTHVHAFHPGHARHVVRRGGGGRGRGGLWRSWRGHAGHVFVR